MRKVVLTGYMGSGKSVIGVHLALQLGVPWIDLDAAIEKTTALSIANLMATRGELYFRKIEHQILTDLLQTEHEFVLSLGGGTPCYYENYKLLSQVESFFLKATVPTLVERLLPERHERPLLANLADSELEEFIAKHLFDRNFYYMQSKYSIATDGKSIAELVAEITKLLA